MAKKLILGHGNWVDGERFWARKKDLELFIARIDEGANQLLVAPRRMGKTSLLHETARRLEQRYLCLFVDLEKSFDAADAIAELSIAVYEHAPLRNRVMKTFRNVMSALGGMVDEIGVSELRVSLRSGLTAGNWQDKGNQLFAILAESDGPVLLLIDEIPLLVNRLLKGDDFSITAERRRAADEFMSWLRENAQRHQGKVRIVLAGSIGLEPVLQQAGLSATLNTFVPFELKPWDEATAVGCIEALAHGHGIDLEAGVPQAMVEKLGCCIPHHVQMFFGHVRDYCKRQNVTAFPLEVLDRVFEKEMLGTRGHAELTHYEERLKLVLGDEVFSLAIDMLTEAAVSKCLTAEALRAFRSQYAFEGRSVEEVQKEIIRVLEHDGYWRQGPEGYVFDSKLLRDWWEARHGFGYVPVEQRGD